MIGLLVALTVFDPFGIPAGTPLSALAVERGNEDSGYLLSAHRHYMNFEEVSVIATSQAGVCTVRAATGHIRSTDLREQFETVRADIESQLALDPDPRFEAVPFQRAVGRNAQGHPLPAEGWSATWFRVSANGVQLIDPPVSKVTLSTHVAEDRGNYLSLRIEYTNSRLCIQERDRNRAMN